MALVTRSNLSKKVSLDLGKCCTSSCELQAIGEENPEEIYKSLTLINACIHPMISNTEVSWDFLVRVEDELGLAIMMCGDLNARSNL